MRMPRPCVAARPAALAVASVFAAWAKTWAPISDALFGIDAGSEAEPAVFVKPSVITGDVTSAQFGMPITPRSNGADFVPISRIAVPEGTLTMLPTLIVTLVPTLGTAERARLGTRVFEPGQP